MQNTSLTAWWHLPSRFLTKRLCFVEYEGARTVDLNLCRQRRRDHQLNNARYRRGSLEQASLWRSPWVVIFFWKLPFASTSPSDAWDKLIRNDHVTPSHQAPNSSRQYALCSYCSYCNSLRFATQLHLSKSLGRSSEASQQKSRWSAPLKLSVFGVFSIVTVKR